MITEQEAELQARVRGVLGDRVKTIEGLPGNWDIEAVRALLPRCPAVFTQLVGMTPARTTGHWQARWSLYILTGHAQGGLARREGDIRQAGLYALIEMLLVGLDGWVSTNGTVKVTQTDNLWTPALEKQGMALVGLTLLAPMEMTETNMETLLTSLRLQYDLSLDARIEAEDNVEIEQS